MDFQCANLEFLQRFYKAQPINFNTFSHFLHKHGKHHTRKSNLTFLLRINPNKKTNRLQPTFGPTLRNLLLQFAPHAFPKNRRVKQNPL